MFSSMADALSPKYAGNPGTMPLCQTVMKTAVGMISKNEAVQIWNLCCHMGPTVFEPIEESLNAEERTE
jgi:hypothetical protein